MWENWIEAEGWMVLRAMKKGGKWEKVGKNNRKKPQWES